MSIMGRKWRIHFNYKVQILLREDEWTTIREGNILAKDGNDALNQIRKRLDNKVFERIVIDVGKPINIGE